MKKFLLYTSLFSLTLLLLVATFECMLIRMPNAFTFKRQLLEQKAGGIKTLIIGNSIVDYGINPAYLADSTCNAALSGQWFLFNRMMLERYIDRLPSLQAVVWGIGSYSLWMDDVDDVDVVYHKIYMDMHRPGDQWPASELIDLRSYSMRKWAKYYIEGGQTLHCDSLGFDHSYALARRGSNWLEDIPRHVRHQCEWKGKDSDGKIFRANLEHMQAIAKLCHERGILLYIVMPPVHPRYYELTDKEQLAITRDAINALCRQWDNVSFYDYFLDTRFTDEDFFDGNHLTSDNGATKFTKLLRKDIIHRKQEVNEAVFSIP